MTRIHTVRMWSLDVIAGVAMVLALPSGGCERRPSSDPAHFTHPSPVATGSAAAPDDKFIPEGHTSASPSSKVMTQTGSPEAKDTSVGRLANQPGCANLDPDDDFVEGPPDSIPDCEVRLEAAQVKFRSAILPTVKKKNLTCGAPQVVQYLHGPTKLRIWPSPLVTCHLALALVRLEEVANRTAKEILGAEIASVTQGGTYNCRSMARFKITSEHSFANAIDIFGFRLTDGRSIPVLRYFGDPKKPATAPESRFLRELANRLFDENVCSVVVTRFYDELHRDHIHCDMAHYHVDGSR